MPTDPQRRRRSVQLGPTDPVYRQVVVMVEPEKFALSTSAVYAFLDGLGVIYDKLPPIPGLGVVPVELADRDDVATVLGRLNAVPAVKVAEQNQYFDTTETLVPPPMSVDDPLYRYQWALFKIGAEAAWAHPAKTSPVVVAILDTGISTTHPDLAPHLWTDAFGHHGVNILTGGTDVEDVDGHGTLVAGAVAAVSNNGVGIAGTPWPIALMAVKFHDARTRPNVLNAFYAIDAARANRADVIAAAWHLPRRSFAIFLVLLIVNAAGIVFVAGAGNDGLDNDTLPTYPASYNLPNVISVMATNEHDSKPGFSSYGWTSVHLAAPGTRVLSTDCFFATARWRLFSGTSAACALVASAAAALKSMNPGWKPNEIRDHLKASVDTVARWLPCAAGGRLSLARAVCGPVHVTAPVAGASVKAGAALAVTWTSSYSTSRCTSVRVLFSATGAAPWTPLTAPVLVGASAATVVLPKATATARIRVQSVQGPGLFDESGLFAVT